VLRYKKGQYYRTHHDMSSQDNELACGPRILTFFLYLSDVQEGGGTNFPRLGQAHMLCHLVGVELDMARFQCWRIEFDGGLDSVQMKITMLPLPPPPSFPKVLTHIQNVELRLASFFFFCGVLCVMCKT
jgi:hypothetical protein